MQMRNRKKASRALFAALTAVLALGMLGAPAAAHTGEDHLEQAKDRMEQAKDRMQEAKDGIEQLKET